MKVLLVEDEKLIRLFIVEVFLVNKVLRSRRQVMDMRLYHCWMKHMILYC